MLYHLGAVSFALHFKNFLIYTLLIALLLTFDNELFSFMIHSLDVVIVPFLFL